MDMTEDGKSPEKPDDDDVKFWEDDDAALARVTECRKSAASFCSVWSEAASECMRFVAGNQWDETEAAELEEQNKPAASINWLARLVNVVCGQQVANRQEVAYLGRTAEDHGGTEMMTNVARWVRDMADEEYEESAAFRDLLVTGMGWTARSMEYDEDPEGKPVKERIDPRRVRWDISARRPSLADRRWTQVDFWMSKNSIRERWGEEVVEELGASTGASRVDADGGAHDAQSAWKYEKNASGIDHRNGEYRVIHHVEWCRHTKYDVANDDGSMVTMTEEQFEEAKDRAEELGMPVPPHAKRQERKYYHVWSTGDKVLERGEAVLQRGFQYECMTGLRDDETGMFYGLVKSGLDPQRFVNTLFISTLHAIKTNAKGGLMVETDAVPNKRQFEENWSKSDAIVWVHPGAIANGKVQAKTPPVLPPQMSQLMQFLVDAIPNIVGVAPELLSQAESAGQPGIVEELRTQAGLTALTPWFDAVRLYMKRDGRVLLEIINRFVADGRMARIVGKEGEQYIPVVRAEGWERYDVSVEEATTTRDAKSRTFLTLMQVTPALAAQGMPPPPSAMDYLPLPQPLIQEWKAAIAEKQNQPPQPSEAEKLLKMKLDADAAKVQAQAQTAAANADREAQNAFDMAQVDAARQVEVEGAQAAQKDRENAGKMQLQREKMQLEREQEQFKALIDVRLTTFEAILKAILAGLQSQQQMVVAREQTLSEVGSGRSMLGERKPQ